MQLSAKLTKTGTQNIQRTARTLTLERTIFQEKEAHRGTEQYKTPKNRFYIHFQEQMLLFYQTC